MKKSELRKLINTSGKRGDVVYKGKDKRKEFDEGVSMKKVKLISNFIGNKTDKIRQILTS
ncbi:hypothetical protein BBI01_03685 [Chryseobacterium artocarpi]|uniref:Uncharacterized protein n=1 Tax=Chryseobacterium artocarpi TaxID=1414727 RepID=A0A1B9A138_9FLAO|nr:hypothetical protein [Chryseobacterium artocarpi]OCA77561.1 hypothetical protein BBI01_03685 [Chryseobacterium artocarpi]